MLILPQQFCFFSALSQWLHPGTLEFALENIKPDLLYMNSSKQAFFVLAETTMKVYIALSISLTVYDCIMPLRLVSG